MSSGVEATAREILHDWIDEWGEARLLTEGEQIVAFNDLEKRIAAALRAAPPSGLTPPRPDVSSGAPAAGSREAIDALRECIGRVRDRLTKFRYRTGPCPFCRSTVHAADCALIPIMDDTAAALVASEQEAK